MHMHACVRMRMRVIAAFTHYENEQDGTRGDTFTWEYKYFRRFGYDRSYFSFEAGRRCTSGAGIYAFSLPEVTATRGG